MTGEELRNVIFSKGVKLKDIADRIGISPQALQGRLSVKNVRSEYATEIIQALKELTDGDVCIQTNKNGDNNFKSLVDASNFVSKIAELKERVKGLESLIDEKDKRIAEKETQLADKERTIKILLERK